MLLTFILIAVAVSRHKKRPHSYQGTKSRGTILIYRLLLDDTLLFVNGEWHRLSMTLSNSGSELHLQPLF